ncbi:TRAP transporter small permease [Salinicola halophyticus]|uniref:TRAP transporter small permease n=1 Tax=Salinicola halophyticus TaxID=1808881 RepID=UPI003F48F5B9
MKKETIHAGIGKCLQGAIVILMIALVVSVFIQVVSRYVLNSSVPWTEELARYILVYLTFIGAALAVHEKTHLNVDFFIEKLPEPVQAKLSAFSGLSIAVTSCLLIFYGGKFAYLGRNTLSPAIEQPMAWVYAIMPVAGGVMLIYAVPQILEGLKGQRVSKGI